MHSRKKDSIQMMSSRRNICTNIVWKYAEQLNNRNIQSGTFTQVPTMCALLTCHSDSPVVWTRLYSKLRTDDKVTDEGDAMVDAASEMFDHMLAGQETSGIAFTYLMYELSRNPSLQEDLRKELSTHLSNDAFSLKQGAIPKSSDIDSLPLLNAIVTETLRLYPPAPMIQPRVVPPEGTFIDGHSIHGELGTP
jgi:hypothetical protein